MTNTQSIEPSLNAIIRDLHRIREEIANSFGGDRDALTNDSREPRARSVTVIWQHKTRNEFIDPSNGSVISLNQLVFAAVRVR
jgi:hypothetical protein